jgi:hypothetical protein
MPKSSAHRIAKKAALVEKVPGESFDALGALFDIDLMINLDQFQTR